MKPPLALFDILGEWRSFSPGIERMKAALKALKDPFLDYPHILVGGSNGKGTVCANVAAAAGSGVGLFLSPHVVDIRERITIDGNWIPDDLWRETYLEARARAGKETECLSYFEWLLLLAVLIFQKQKVNLAIFEVGLGGLMDATNALEPQISAITNVSLEHTQQLGNTRELIAFHKMGIARPFKPFFLPTDVMALKGVSEYCAQRELSPELFDNKGTYRDNYSLAKRILRHLGKENLKNVILPGRREIIHKNIYLDGSHNVAAWLDMVDWYKSKACGEKANIICTLTRGRCPDTFLKIVKEISLEIYHYEVGYEMELEQGKWPPEVKSIGEVSRNHLFKDPLLVCGSLYLIGPFKNWLKGVSR